MKNWTVKSEAIKQSSSGLIAYISYLKNGEADSHDNTTIVDLSNADKALSNILMSVENRKFERSKEKKAGGRPISSLAQSFVLSLPPEIEPTAEQWKAIGKDCIKAVARSLGVPAEDLYKQTAFVLHKEPEKNSHLNLVFGKIVNGQVLKDLQRKRVILDLKNAFNLAILTHTNNKVEDYTPLNEKVGKVPLWKAREQKALIVEARNTALLEDFSKIIGELKGFLKSFFKAFKSDDIGTQKKEIVNIELEVKKSPSVLQKRIVGTLEKTVIEEKIEAPLLNDCLSSLREEIETVETEKRERKSRKRNRRKR